MITLHTLIAAAIGSILTLLGFWGSAIADRLRYPRLRAELEALRATPYPAPSSSRSRAAAPPRKPQRRAPAPAPVRAPRSEVEQWLEDVGYDPVIAARAAAAAQADAPDGTIEDQIRAAMRHLPATN